MNKNLREAKKYMQRFTFLTPRHLRQAIRKLQWRDYVSCFTKNANASRHRVRVCEGEEECNKKAKCREKYLTVLSGAQPQQRVRLLRKGRAMVTPTQHKAPVRDARMQVMRDEFKLMMLFASWLTGERTND